MLIEALVFAAGLFAWTMAEYVIHGVLGHAHRTFVMPLHGVHHRDPHAVFALGAWLPAALRMRELAATGARVAPLAGSSNLGRMIRRRIAAP